MKIEINGVDVTNDCIVKDDTIIFCGAQWPDTFTIPIESPTSTDTGQGWVRLEKGCEMPDYDVPVIWLQENGSCVVDALDKDGNPHLFEMMYFDNNDKDIYLGNVVTHWHKLPILPEEKLRLRD